MFKRMISSCLALVLLFTVASYTFCEEPLSEGKAKYEAEKKNPTIAGLLAAFPYTGLLGLGHLYAGHWVRSLPFLLADFAGLLVAIAESGAGNKAQVAGGIIFYTSYIWEIFDAAQTANDYNKKLKEKYGLDVVLKNNAPALQFSLEF